MKKTALAFLLIHSLLISNCQVKDTWVQFWNKDSSLTGYKDKNGVIKIKPTFIQYCIGNRFDDIIAVTDNKWNSYYLIKNGRKIGRDSLYHFDNGDDCESEGFIRFRDRKTDKAGIFNSKGEIAVPAIYNDLTRVNNGMIVAIKDATKKKWFDHFVWSGGKNLLIDTNNNVLIDDFKYNANINFYTLLITEQPSPDTLRHNYKSTNGKYYSFVDFDKEFKAWLANDLLNHFTKEDLLKTSFEKISYWNEDSGWVSESKFSFIEKNFAIISNKLLQLKSPGCQYDVFNESLNGYIFDSEKYAPYFNNCGESMEWIYPVQNVVISYNDMKNLIQDHFSFLKTEDGYKLISVSVSNGQLNY